MILSLLKKRKKQGLFLRKQVSRKVNKARSIMAQQDDEKLKRRAEFLEQKRKRREAEAKTQEQIIEEAKEIFSTPASKEFFKKLEEEREKNKSK